MPQCVFIIPNQDVFKFEFQDVFEFEFQTMADLCLPPFLKYIEQKKYDLPTHKKACITITEFLAKDPKYTKWPESQETPGCFTMDNKLALVLWDKKINVTVKMTTSRTSAIDILSFPEYVQWCNAEDTDYVKITDLLKSIS